MKINYQSNLFYPLYLTGFFIILALPLLNWPIYFSPPNWAKTLVFQMVFAILLFIFLCHFLWERNSTIFDKVKKITKENFGFWLLLLVFVTQLAATIFSVDFRYSFFGSPYRGGGFINYGFYILFAAGIFLTVKHKDWQKLWDFSILVGFLVSILALVSRFGLLGDIFISRIDNLSSTIGGPNTLGLYLLLLVFPVLSFGIQESNKIKKIFYLASFVLFCSIIVLTISQGAYLGLGIGMLYFLTFYPLKSLLPIVRKKVFYAKLTFVAFIILAVASVFFIKSNPDIGINNHYLFRNLTTWKIDQSRLATWQVATKAFLDRPLLGFGLENFSIGFDRHYDPSLSSIQMDEVTPASWWDKAHNFAFNLLVETGIIGFLSFMLLFGFLFWSLHTLKRQHNTENQNQSANINTKNIVIAHGLQATIIAYFTNLIFNFENFSSYILVFLAVGYILHLTIKETPTIEKKYEPGAIKLFLFRHKKTIGTGGFLLLILFIWFFNIKPFKVNTQINKARYLTQAESVHLAKGQYRMCDQSLAVLDQEIKKHSIIDGYLRQKYVDIVKICIGDYPENDVAYAKKVIPILQENTHIMPHYTRNWLMLAAFNNMLIVSEPEPEKKKELINQNMGYLKKASELSPNRHEILVEILNSYLFEGNYELVRKTSETCTKTYPDFGACWWYLGLSQIYLAKDPGAVAEGKKNMEIAQELGYSQLSDYSLTQLALLYINTKNYQELEWVYKNLTEFYPLNPRYFAGLSLVYKKNGKLAESTEALKQILRIQADVKKVSIESEETITLLIENILGLPKTSPNYHRALYNLYLQMANEEKDPIKSAIYKKKADEEYNLSR